MYDDTIMVDKDYYNKLKEQVTWISTKDRLPDEGSRVLVAIHMPTYSVVRSGKYHDGLFSIDNGDIWMSGDKEVTCWQYLPEPPKEETDENV